MSNAHDLSRVLRIAAVIAGVFALLIAAPIARAAWPPAADATPEEVVAALHEEVQQIAQVDREPARRFWAARALDASDFAADEEFVADLFAEWIIDPSLVVRQAALTHFPRYIVEGRDDQRGRRAVVGRFDDPAEEVRSAAAAVVVGETLDDFFIEILPATEPGERERIRENARRWREAGVARGLSADEAFVRRACRKHLMVDDEFSPEAVAGLTDALASRWVNAQREALVLLQRCELPVEQRQKIADAGARSRDPLVRREAMTLGERDPLRLGEWLLSDHDPIVRASAFDSRFMPPGYDARPALFERAFADRDGRVVNAAARCVRARNVTLNLDRDALLSRCRADDVETAGLAAKLFVEQAIQDSAPDEIPALIAAELERFRAAPPGASERRAAALRLDAFLRRAPRALPERALDVVESAAVAEMTAAVADPDAAVRRTAYALLGRACAAPLGPAGSTTVPDCLWPLWLRGVDDPEPSVRRTAAASVVAALERGLGSDGVLPLLDAHSLLPTIAEPTRRASLGASATRALNDPDQVVADEGFRYFQTAYGLEPWLSESLPAAPAAGMAVYLERRMRRRDLHPEREGRLDEQAVAAFEALAKFAVERLTGDDAVDRLLHGPELELDRPSAAVDYLTARDRLDVLFARLLATRSCHAPRRLLATLLVADLDEADVGDVNEFAEQVDASRLDLLRAAILSLTVRETKPASDPIHDWLKDESPRMLRYAALELAGWGEPKAERARIERLREVLHSSDPLTCLLALQALQQWSSAGAAWPERDDEPRHVRALLGEAARRAPRNRK